MTKRILFISIACLTFFAQIIGQSSTSSDLENLKLAISVDQTVIKPGNKVIVRVTAVNKTGHIIDPQDVRVRLVLSRHGKEIGECTGKSCYGGYFFLKTKFENNVRYVFTIKPSNLYWHDLLSSALDLREPRNFYDEVIPGDYSLFLDLNFQNGKLPDGTPQTISITSNIVSVKIEAKH